MPLAIVFARNNNLHSETRMLTNSMSKMIGILALRLDVAWKNLFSITKMTGQWCEKEFSQSLVLYTLYVY